MRIFSAVMACVFLSGCTQAYWQSTPQERAEREIDRHTQDSDKYQDGFSSAALAFLTMGTMGDQDYVRRKEAEEERNKDKIQAKEALKEVEDNLAAIDKPLSDEEIEELYGGFDDETGFVERNFAFLNEDLEEDEPDSVLDGFKIGQTTFIEISEVLGRPTYQITNAEGFVEARFVLKEDPYFWQFFDENEENYVRMNFDDQGQLLRMEIE